MCVCIYIHVTNMYMFVDVCLCICRCIYKYIPIYIYTLQRGHWFPNPGDIESFRSKISLLCPLPKKSQNKKRYKLIIYQRDISRKLVDQDISIQKLNEHLDMNLWNIEVLMHKKDRSPCELSSMLYNAGKYV
jgi:hypothetical protein